MDSRQSMASSSPSTVASSEQTSHFTSQTEIEMEFSKAHHWSQLDYSTTDSEWSAESNSKYFDLLKEDPERGRFFMDFETLEVGEKISGGAQADIYEARNTCDGPFDLVVKVMKGNAPLEAFQVQWPIGMLSARSKYKHLFDLPLLSIQGGTVLRDKRLRGQFAFVMYRRWGDLRLLIDRRMKQKRSTRGPFSLDKAIQLMLSIGEDMAVLHDKHDIIHRDLKASNVLVWGEFGEDMRLVAPLNRVARIGSVVADFECSVGVLGTGFWRAPEILKESKEGVQFTRASDVYSYAMTCYEIVTGCIPYDGLGGSDTKSQILNGQRPELPDELPMWLRNIIVGCWHSDPLERLTFSDICKVLKLKRGPNPVSVVIDNTSQVGASIVKVEQWINPQPLTLLEVMEKLMDMDLSILTASDSSSTNMITQYFEVVDCKGKKVVNDKSIARITEVLSLPVKMKWIGENLGTSIDENSTMQMHVIEVFAKRRVEVVAKRSAGLLLGSLSTLLVAPNFRVHSAGCWTRKGRVECVIYVESARTSTLLWELRHKLEFISLYFEHFKMIAHRVAAEDFSHLKRRLHNLKSMDLTFSPSSSNTRVHQRKESEQYCSKVVICLENREPLVHVSCNLAGMEYKFVGANIEYRGPYEFLKGRANRSKDIDVGSIGGDESCKIHRILDVAVVHGCPEVNGQLILHGPKKELHDDLMRSLRENNLSVFGGQVYFEKGGNREIEFFVTENPGVRAA